MQNDLSKQIISSFAEIAKEKGIDRDLLLSILEDVFRTMIRKKYETDDAFEVILNADRGEIQILHVQEVVPAEELSDPVADTRPSFFPSFRIVDDSLVQLKRSKKK